MTLLLIWLLRSTEPPSLGIYIIALFMIGLVVVNALLIVAWIHDGYCSIHGEPKGWKRWDDKIFSPQWFANHTNCNDISCLIYGMIVFTFLFEIYKIPTFIFDMFWFFTHVGNKKYKDII